MKSLRVRVLRAVLLLLTVVGVAAALSAYLVTQGEPDDLLDDQLRQIALYVGDAPRALPPADVPTIEADDAIVVVIRDAEGRIIRQSDATMDLPISKETGFSDPVVDGETWRTYTLAAPDRLIQVAQRQSTRDELAADGAMQTAAPILLLIPLSWLVVNWLVRRLFRPLDRLTEELRERPAERMTPLPVEGLPSEVAPLVVEMNSLLGRQHELLELRKRFVSDAAHQLRTPLTALQLQARNLARSPGAEPFQVEIADMQRGVVRMTRMTSQLLDLARAEAPIKGDVPTPRELAQIVRQAIETLLPLADERGIDLGVTSEVDVALQCSEQDLTAVLTNVLDNAVRYTPDGGRVDVSTERLGSGARVVVRDTGPGIPTRELDRVFDRFWRAGRTGSNGAGLGLAIVKAIAERAGMDVRLENVDDPSGLRVSIDILNASR